MKIVMAVSVCIIMAIGIGVAAVRYSHLPAIDAISNGEHVYLWIPGRQIVLLSPDQDAMNEKLRIKRDDDLAAMAASGRLIVLLRNTEAYVADAGLMVHRVRVTNGEDVGVSGLIEKEFVHRIPTHEN